MRRNLLLVGSLLVLALLLGGPLHAQPAQKVVFALNWFAVGEKPCGSNEEQRICRAGAINVPAARSH